MSEQLDRRDAVKAVAAAGGLLLLAAPAPADEPEAGSTALTGEWFNGGKLDQPCAIIQQGRVLILVNEKGDIATAQMTEANQFTVVRGWGGDEVGKVSERGKVIAWKGGGNWKRR
jgi:hypothetical protein